jgi:RHS repeat-associated protein
LSCSCLPISAWSASSRCWATDASGTQTYFLYDALGSTTDPTDGSGNVTTAYGYDVFGALRSGTPGANEWLFTSEQRDVESGLYYLRAWYYDPAIGRFLSQDPLRIRVPLIESRHLLR